MDSGGADVQDVLLAIAGPATGLLGQKRDRVRLVEEAQLPLRVRGRRRVQENASLEQGPVKVGDQRTDVARGVSAAGAAGAKVGEEPAVRLRKTVAIRFIHRVEVAARGHG